MAESGADLEGTRTASTVILAVEDDDRLRLGLGSNTE